MKKGIYLINKYNKLDYSVYGIGSIVYGPIRKENFSEEPLFFFRGLIKIQNPNYHEYTIEDSFADEQYLETDCLVPFKLCKLVELLYK